MTSENQDSGIGVIARFPSRSLRVWYDSVYIKWRTLYHQGLLAGAVKE